MLEVMEIGEALWLRHHRSNLAKGYALPIATGVVERI